MPEKMTERKRIETVLAGSMPDRLPWATRLEIWYYSLLRTGRLPEQFVGKSLNYVHEYLGVGRQAYCRFTPFKLTGVDCRVVFEGKEISHLHEPALDFPKPYTLVPREVPGRTEIMYESPAGTLVSIYRTTQEILDWYSQPYLEKHVLSTDDDYAVINWILDKGEPVADFESFSRLESEIGDNGMTMGMIERIPFQRLLLDFMGEERCFFQMHDNKKAFDRVLDQLTEIHWASLKIACQSPATIVECTDNLDGTMTNPDLFRQYSMPVMQETADTLHAAGKYFASHLDGDISLLVDLIPETGLDVAESFSPYPLSRLTFEKAYAAWKTGPLMWGILPSPLFEARVPPETFRSEIGNIIDTIEPEHPQILGVADQAVGLSLWERIRDVGDMLQHR
ncbi:MAG: hypothetical protein JW852_05830 [Spirochaetales bacterium]|nr:hypothetical protein [Spirochaetales bacterium]